MAETMNVTIDDLPELGTKAAAVAGIESMLHAAIRLREPFSPLQLRYWLDAYYQARRAQEIEDAESQEELARQKLLHALISGPKATADVLAPLAAKEIEEDDGADVSAPPEQADAEDGQKAAAEAQQKPEDATSSVTAEAVTPSPQGEGRPRQKPVGWTDGFEPVEIKKGPAAEAAKFKREQFERLQRFLREGVTMQRIVKAADGNITEDQILGIRECRRVPVAVYRVLEAALDRIETD